MDDRNDLRSQFYVCVENFNFDKVLKVMNFLDWTYWDGAPNKQRLVSLSCSLFEMALSSNRPDTYASSGGIKVSIIDGKVHLEFVAESS